LYNKLILTKVITCFIIGSLFSQSNESELETFVVTAQYEKTTKEKAVNKIRVISREKIDALAAVNLGDVLKNELNIRLSQDNILGSFMSLQGISGQNVKILIDGIPIIGRLSGNIDVSQINLNNIERIEIVEGPLSTIYGSDSLA
jgi:outer membrane receptor for ferrienterochelin and colicins